MLGHLGLREIGLVLHEIDSSGQQFVNRFIYLIVLWRSVPLTGPLKLLLRHFLLHAVVPLNILEILHDINHFVVLNIWTMGIWRPPHFTVPVEELSAGKGILPGIPIVARPHNPDPLVILFRDFPPKIL